MSINNEIQVESEFNKLNISNEVSVTTNHENWYKPDDDKLWCKECVPRCIVEGWTSENHDIDEFIKDTIYNAKYTLQNILIVAVVILLKSIIHYFLNGYHLIDLKI